MNWSDLFTNPLTVAALALILVGLFRKVYENEERKLAWWIPLLFTGVLTLSVYIGEQVISQEIQVQFTDFLTMLSVVFAAAGMSLYAQYNKDERIEPEVARGFYVVKEKPFRTWSKY